MSDALEAELLACETKVWEALKAGDPGADAASLSEDFLGIYPDGFATKADHVDQVSGGATVSDYRLSDIRVIAMGHDHAALCYRADFTGFGADRPGRMYVTSIWRREGGTWINILSQDTPAGRPAGTDWV